MNPWVADTAKPHTQLPSQVFPHRSWSDDQVPPNPRPGYSTNTHAPRSASFSDSRPAARPNWKDLPPPPPLPPLPPSLLPGFHSPALAHSDRDLFFVGAPRYAQSPRQSFYTPLAAAGPSQSTLHQSNIPMPSPAFPWSPQQNSGSGLTAAPAVPARPSYGHGYTHSTENQAAQRPVSSGHFFMASSPPPVVPPRPTTAHDDMRYLGSASAPPIPPKISTSPLVPNTPNSAPSTNAAQEFLPPRENSNDEYSQFAKDLLSSISNTPIEALQPANENLKVSPKPSKTASGHSRTQSADDIARAMELSLAESQSHSSGSQKIQDEEDRALQQALADSLVDPRLTSRPNTGSELSQDPSEGSSTQIKQSPAVTSETVPETSSSADREAESEAKRLQRERDGKAALRKLMEQEEKRLAEEKIRIAEQKRELERKDEEMARQQLEQDRAQKEAQEAQERRDAELARRLASGNEAGPSHVSMPALSAASAPVPKPTPPGHARAPASAPPTTQELARKPSTGPPQYDDVVTSGPSLAPVPRQQTRPLTSYTPAQSSPVGSAPQNMRGRTTSAMATSPASPQGRPQFSRASSVGAGAVAQANPPNPANATRPQVSPPNPVSATRPQGPPPHTPAGPSTTAAPAANMQQTPNARPGPGSSSNGAASSSGRTDTASQEESETHELLRSVSYGFEPPKTQLAPVQIADLPPCPPLPEVVTLHPAPAPPFHIMAASWRHLMRLLAQFETRIEASVSTIAQTKDESFLRVVIQFVKLPYTANEWRTVIYLSIDQPVPQNTPQAFRYSNGDTNVIPYSIARGETPIYLKKSALSHVYTVPLSQSTPFPILPVALPNLALYLQSAMRDSRSRKVQNDTSNTMRRLARMVGSCYPEEVPNTDTEERESGRGMGGLFKRVVGRKRRDTQGNEEVYDMVTPFRIDKYTAVS